MNCQSNEPRVWLQPDLESLKQEQIITSDLLSMLDYPQTAIERIAVGPKAVAVLCDGRLGVSTRLGAQPVEQESEIPAALTGSPIINAASLIQAATPYSRCIGLAACNAGVKTQSQPFDLPADRLIAALGRNKHVGLVGFFPFTEKLQTEVGKLDLFELREVPGCVPRNRWESVLGQIDVLAVTGTALLTQHLSFFLNNARQAKRIVLGPSTPLSPVLFKYGADVLAGSVIVDIDCVLDGIKRGYSFRRIKAEGGLNFVQLIRPGFEVQN